MDSKIPTILKIESEPNSPDTYSEATIFRNLFKELSNTYGREQLLKYIEDNSSVAPVVITGWLEGRIPSSNIRKIIFNTLRNFRSGDLPELPISQDIPKLIPEEIVVLSEEEKEKEKEEEEEKGIKEVASKKIRNRFLELEQQKKDEAEGRYEGLNLYESDLLDYLKSVFVGLEFSINDIKFEVRKVRKHGLLFQHIAYLRALGYLEGPYERKGRFFYKIK